MISTFGVQLISNLWPCPVFPRCEASSFANLKVQGWVIDKGDSNSRVLLQKKSGFQFFESLLVSKYNFELDNPKVVLSTDTIYIFEGDSDTCYLKCSVTHKLVKGGYHLRAWLSSIPSQRNPIEKI